MYLLNNFVFRPRNPQQTYRVMSNNQMQNKIRVPQPRIASIAAPRKIVAPQQLQQQPQQINNNIVINNSNVNRIVFQQQPNQSPNQGGQYIVQNNQLHQINSPVNQQYVQQVKTPQQQTKLVQMQTSTPYQNQTTTMVKKLETPNSSPIPPSPKPSEQPTTTTLLCKKKDGDFDDLEDSIEATVVSRTTPGSSTNNEQQNNGQGNSTIPLDDYRR